MVHAVHCSYVTSGEKVILTPFLIIFAILPIIMFIIASHAESLSFKLASFYVLCFLARDSRSKAGHSGVMSFIAVSSSRNKQYHNLH